MYVGEMNSINKPDTDLMHKIHTQAQFCNGENL